MAISSRTMPHGVAFWVLAVSFLLTMSYATIPTPLYPLYQERDGFPVWVITIIFAAFAVGVVFSLFFLGHISDWVGRRRMIVIAVLVSALSAAVFLLWNDVPGLMAARFVNGVSIGILTAAATVHLSELRSRARPEEPPIFAASVAGAANLGGLGLGTLIGGLFAGLLPDPLILPHAVYLVLLVVIAGTLLFVPETVTPPEPRPRYRPQRVALPETSRSSFLAAGLGGFASFAVFGLFSSLAPTFLIDAFGERDHLFAGAAIFSIFLAAAVAQLALVRVALKTQLTVSLVCCIAGLVTVAIGALLPALAVFLAGGIIAGIGVGILFRSAIATAGALAEPGRRGETLALVFLIGYCGLALPAIAVGISLTFASETTVLIVFSSLVLVATVIAGGVMRRRAV